MKMWTIPLTLLLAATGCKKPGDAAPESPPPPEPAQPEAAASAPASEPSEQAGPPPRGDDADRKSKNGRLEAEVGGVPVLVHYGRPAVQDRKIFGELIPYGEVWRTGADEATTITFGSDATFAGKPVKAGSYALFTVPNKEAWQVILNAEAKQWGAYKRDAQKDILTSEVTPKTAEEANEVLTFTSTEDALVLAWADVEVVFPVGAAP